MKVKRIKHLEECLALLKLLAMITSHIRKDRNRKMHLKVGGGAELAKGQRAQGPCLWF